jgi:hypothetical protein
VHVESTPVGGVRSESSGRNFYGARRVLGVILRVNTMPSMIFPQGAVIGVYPRGRLVKKPNQPRLG